MQYLKKELSYEVDVLHADKYESFIQVDTIIFNGVWLDMFKVPRQVYNVFLRDLTALADSNTTLTIYHTCNFQLH